MKLAGSSLSALVLTVSVGCNLTGNDSSGASTDGSGSAGSSGSSAGGTAGTGATASTIDEAGSNAVVQRTAIGWSGQCEQFEAASDYAWDTTNEVSIVLKETEISSQSSAVVFDGRCVTISASGNYRISGSLGDGCIQVDSKDEGVVRLILGNVDVSSSLDAALHIVNAKKTVIVLADGSTNVLTDSTNYATTAEANAALYSQDDLIITGNGALTVNGKYNDGITSKNGLIIKSGAITVNAVDDGIRGKDCLVIDGGSIVAQAGGDALKSDNEDDVTLGYVLVNGGKFDVTAAGDGISASTNVYLTNGTLALKTGGGSGQLVASDSSAKGIKGAAGVVIDGGSLQINAADDGVHAGSAIYLNGGALNIASADDAIHCDASVELAGANVNVTQSYEGIEGTVITLVSGTAHVVSSDDGLNASDGSGTAMNEPGIGTMGNGAPGGVNGAGGAPPWGMGTRPDMRGSAPGSMFAGTMGSAGNGNQASVGPMPMNTIPMGGASSTGMASAGGATTGNLLIHITGGRLVVDASGDGIDSNGSIVMSGGTVLVSGPVDNGNAALDKGDGQDCLLTINGGFLVAAGSAGMAEAPSPSSAQSSIFLATSTLGMSGPMPSGAGFNASADASALEAGTVLQILNADAAALVTYAPPKRYAAVIFSSPQLVAGSYSVQTGGTCTGSVTDNLYEDASCSNGTQRANLTVDMTTSASATWSL
ncbi:MAG: carbohydrate-binding domain-containing protein [Myxococcales bacterium]